MSCSSKYRVISPKEVSGSAYISNISRTWSAAIFDKGFNQMQYGYASAISTVVMIIFALIAFAQFKVNNGGET